MDDQLRQRLRDADPLDPAAGTAPDPARLDALRDRIMATGAGDTAPAPSGSGPRPGHRPRALGLTALMASGLAAVLVVATLVRPSTAALAWDPSPTAATPAQEAAARDACRIPEAVPAGPIEVKDLPSGGESIVGTTGVTVTGGSSSGSGVITDGSGPLPSLPSLPTTLPPLVYLELHGTGAVAVFADDATSAYCLLVAHGDGFDLAGIQVQLGDGASFGVGVGQGSVGVTNTGTQGVISVSGSTTALEGGLKLNVMVVDYGTSTVGIMAGEAPDGAATVRVEGGPADGATATVHDGRFALWTPDVLDATSTVIALDANGAEVGRQVLEAPPAPAP